MLYSEEAARANVRSRDGRRVFFLGSGDNLTSAARDYLRRERIEILPAEAARPERFALLGGGYCEEKPEHMTHLDGVTLAPKTHPRILFRGKVDTLEAQLILCRLRVPRFGGELKEILALKIRSARIPRMIVTMGSQGAVYADCTGERGVCPGRKVDVKDTTGAGDAFFAGATIGLTYGKTLAESCEIGTRLAASTICTSGNVCPRFLPEEFGLDVAVTD